MGKTPHFIKIVVMIYTLDVPDFVVDFGKPLPLSGPYFSAYVIKGLGLMISRSPSSYNILWLMSRTYIASLGQEIIFQAEEISCVFFCFLFFTKKWNNVLTRKCN